MGNVAVRVDNLGKLYHIGQGKTAAYETLSDRIVDIVTSPFRSIRSVLRGQSSAVATDSIWALKDVSFEVQHGEVVGIIGRNGAGKSTLLKILSQITEPTEGSIDIYGRVGALLEVGTGFHPELTGRENVYLNGAILGMKRAEINRKFEEIVDFSGVERFIDTPVKHYSSGMQVRLAFAVAAHLEPEILVVDEVLAVGDAEFQKKCLGKMGDVTKEGRTVLFVSHNMGAIRNLTRQCVFLREGQVVAYDNTPTIVDMYMAEALHHSESEHFSVDFYRRQKRQEGFVNFSRVWVEGSSGPITQAPMGEPLTICLQIEVEQEVRGVGFSFVVKNTDGVGVVTFASWDSDFTASCPVGSHIIRLSVGELPLTPEQYFADVGAGELGHLSYDFLIDIPLVKITNEGQLVYRPKRPWGVIYWDKVHWSTKL